MIGCCIWRCASSVNYTYEFWITERNSRIAAGVGLRHIFDLSAALKNGNEDTVRL